MQNARLDEAQTRIEISGRNINNLRYTDDTTLMGESKELEEPLDKSERGELKFWLKGNIQKTEIMVSSRIPLRQTVTDFIFLGSIITADGDCSHEIKRHLLLGRKAMTNLDSILKSRDITLPTEIHLVKFSSVQSLSRVRSLQPHELQHARPPCSSPSPGVHSDSCPSSP